MNLKNLLSKAELEITPILTVSIIITISYVQFRFRLSVFYLVGKLRKFLKAKTDNFILFINLPNQCTNDISKQYHYLKLFHSKKSKLMDK